MRVLVAVPRRPRPALAVVARLTGPAALRAQPTPLQGFDAHAAKGYGVRHLANEGSVDEHTRFAIGSTTKAMTAAALAMLVEAGRWRGMTR